MSVIRRSTVRRISMALLLSMFAMLLAFTSIPSASAHPGHVHYLRLISLHCYSTNENGADGDEPYLKIGGTTVWSSNHVFDGTTRNLRSIPLNAFWSSTDVALWEDDPGGGFPYYDKDDYINSKRIYTTPGTYTILLTGADATYQLTYQVI